MQAGHDIFIFFIFATLVFLQTPLQRYFPNFVSAHIYALFYLAICVLVR